jgi:hypothetical protein
VAPIGRFCAGRNQRCQPFAWTKDTDQILAKLNSGNTTATSDHKGDIPERWPKRRSRPTSSGSQPSRYRPAVIQE